MMHGLNLTSPQHQYILVMRGGPWSDVYPNDVATTIVLVRVAIDLKVAKDGRPGPKWGMHETSFHARSGTGLSRCRGGYWLRWTFSSEKR